MSSGRVAVLCPSRGRSQELRELRLSVRETSDADVLAYVDEDQAQLYNGQEPAGQRIVGPRIGPVAAANVLVDKHPNYDLYGLVTDDARLTVPAWDEWALEAASKFPNRICVISPFHNQGNHVDMPFVTAEWIRAVGWFACPDCYHYCWPIITGLIGEMSAIVHAPSHGFAIHHPHKIEMVSESVRNADAQAFFEFVSTRLPAVVERVRSAMTI